MLRLRHQRDHHRQQLKGFTLIELMVVLVIFAILLALGMPVYQGWAARTKVRVAGESLLSGLVTARMQALQLNSQVHFYLTNNLTAACALSNTGSSWIVSRDSPAGKCNIAPSDTVDPRIIQSRSGSEGGTAPQISALNATNAAANRIIFSGLGRTVLTDSAGVNTNPISRIDITFPSAGACEHSGGTVRCLRLLIGNGGEARLCDPVVTAASDPRLC